MFRKAAVIMSLALAVTMFSAPAYALNVPGMSHHVTGNVTAIDRDTNTFTVTDDKTQKSFIFSAKDSGMLNAISKGEHVRVGYSKKGNQLTATKIAPKAAASRTARGNR